ncbi:MAG TPA: hypothetical protein VIV12_07365 [Streptosporangiaceae bacterium]
MSARQPERSAVLAGDMKRVIREQWLGFVVTVSQDGPPSLSPGGRPRSGAMRMLGELRADAG